MCDDCCFGCLIYIVLGLIKMGTLTCLPFAGRVANGQRDKQEVLAVELYKYCRWVTKVPSSLPTHDLMLWTVILEALLNEAK